MSPIWLDVTAREAEKTRAFYGALFGWQINVEPAMDYGLISGADGIAGGIGQERPGNQHPAGVVAYLPVEDVDAALTRAEQLGGACAVPVWEAPGLGRMAVFTDPEGNRVGLWQRGTLE